MYFPLPIPNFCYSGALELILTKVMVMKDILSQAS